MIDQKKNKKKRKLTLNTVWLILLVAVAAANLYVWRIDTAGEEQIAGLTGNISALEQQIDEITLPADDLDAKLVALEAELALTQEGFPATVDRNEVTDYLLKTAEECGVQILPLVSEGWSEENIGQSYNVLSLSAIAEGSLTDVKKFITCLQNGRYKTLTIPDCTVERKDTKTISSNEDEMQVTVDIKIGIYTFSPEGSVS